MQMLKYMQPFLTDYVPRVLLTGNGLHRAFEDANWDKLLKDIAGDRFSEEEWKRIGNLPYPQMAIVASGNHLGEGMKRISEGLIQAELLPGEGDLIRKVAAVGFDVILTTNYSYEIEKALFSEFQIAVGKASRYRKKTCKDKPKEESQALYQYISIPSENGEKNIWHIHGEAAKSDSMIIGHYYYGKILSRIQSYTAETIRRYRIAERSNKLFYPRSWVDYFLFGDVFIIGQGMDQSEMDLWWLTDCKKRNGKGALTLYKPGMKPEEKALAGSCGIVLEDSGVPDNFKDYYCLICDELKRNMKDK